MAAQARRLTRSSGDRRLAGVCAGIAEYLEVDPTMVRLATVALIFIIPPAIVVGYLAAWLIVPEAPSGRTAARAGFSTEAAGAATGASAYAADPSGGTAAPPTAGQAFTPAARSGLWVNADGSVLAGLAMVGAGILFLLLNLDILDWEIFRFWRWRIVWPAVLILVGCWLVAKSVGASRGAGGDWR